ncbi:MAG: hypothetical protein DME57_07535 [Verrucomicrobia bacterium]|nr:MAG: hypothetical protein DME57_07535 [Verrucomicrobiota bacterium]
MGRAFYWAGPRVVWDRAVAAATPRAAYRANDHYQPQFDGIRALAVLTVMVDHFSADVPNFPLPDWIHLGATGVRLFLVLSGYFITASLRRARECTESGALSLGKTIGAFYWRRFLRIAPAYFVFTLVAFLLGLGAVRQNWPWILTGTVNWMIPFVCRNNSICFGLC